MCTTEVIPWIVRLECAKATSTSSFKPSGWRVGGRTQEVRGQHHVDNIQDSYGQVVAQTNTETVPRAKQREDGQHDSLRLTNEQRESTSLGLPQSTPMSDSLQQRRAYWNAVLHGDPYGELDLGKSNEAISVQPAPRQVGIQQTGHIPMHEQAEQPEQPEVNAIVIGVDECLQSDSDSDFIAANNSSASETMDILSCSEQSSYSEAPSIEAEDEDWCHCHDARESDGRTATHIESDQLIVEVAEVSHASHSVTGGRPVTTDSPQAGQTTDGFPYTEQSSDEDGKRSWYEEQFMDEVEHLPEKRRRTQISLGPGMVRLDEVGHFE